MLDVSMDHSQVFSEYFWKPVELVVFLASIMLLVSCITRRMPNSTREAKQMGTCNWAILFTLCDSLVFVLMCTIVVFGVGTSRSSGVCDYAYWICIFAYAVAKLSISFFLLERSRLVRTPVVPRRESKLYIFNWGLSSLWLVCLVLMIVERKPHIRANGECSIDMSGGGPAGALVAVDVFLNTYYTLLFAWPLWRGEWNNPALRRLAWRSCLAAVLCTTGSVTNLSLYAIHHGVELAQVCLATCILDTSWCAIVLCTLTHKRDTSADSHPPTRASVSRSASSRPWITSGTGTSPPTTLVWDKTSHKEQGSIKSPTMTKFEPQLSPIERDAPAFAAIRVDRTMTEEVDRASEDGELSITKDWPMSSSPV